jgi:subtilisin family serine protease
MRIRQKRYWLVIFAAMWAFLIPGAPAADPAEEYLLHVKTADWPAASIEQLAQDYRLTVIARLPQIEVWVVKAIDPRRPIDQAVLQTDRRVAWIEPNGLVYATGVIPNDPWYGPRQQPYLQMMGLPQGWQLTRGNAQPVAMVDTGVDLDHPDLAAKIWTNAAEVPGNGVDDEGNGYVDDVHGWNFVGNNAVPQDDSNHGSHVAGSAAAQTDNGVGMAGMSWYATIMPIKTLGANATGTFSNTAAGIIYAADNGARLINLSLGGDYSATIEAAVHYAQSKGCLLIASTGNDGLGTIDYPAALSGVLAVGSNSLSEQRSTFSNYGPSIDVVAPGEDILSANRLGSYSILDGTSMSTAHASGLAQLIWSAAPTLSAADVAQIITSTAHDVAAPDWDAFTGWGRIDAYAALRQVSPDLWYLPVVIRD